ncbi:MAG: DoxX family membrane protein [Candidatus Nomurabacteria bacterium]|nr:DoxX family membrane protein [Candidatus Nomurabacteria bacterium]
MNKIINILEKNSGAVLRYGMSFVILWFSIQQFLHANIWTAYVPDSAVAMTHLSAITLVYFNAVFELVFGIMLVLGWQTRLAALLLSLHLFDIMYVVGYGEIGIRDLGLAIATFVIFMNGADYLCYQTKEETEEKINYSNTTVGQNLQQIKKI